MQLFLFAKISLRVLQVRADYLCVITLITSLILVHLYRS